MADQFGFTNDEAELEAVKQFREAAVNDGWSIAATYKNEPVESCASLERDGFSMRVLTRVRDPKKGKYKYETQIALWGPDQLALRTPKAYSMQAIIDGLRICDRCNSQDVDTQRVAFANRVCANCLAKARAELEKPGWCD